LTVVVAVKVLGNLKFVEVVEAVKDRKLNL
jgi:hypothetical protein